MKLIERIDAALDRIASGQAPMRVPVEVTDVDVVLSACRSALSAAESKVDALMREKEVLRLGLKNVIRVSDEFVEDTGLKHGDPLTDAVDAVRALVREQHTTQDEDCASTRAGNHPSATGG